ncbi:MAG TPA: DNA repair protein RecO [Povalibacter sp.]|nr:DNA repair protein RecO [Povalibacter sp.]
MRRVQLQPAYVLHHRSYRDTSRILELFTPDHGRVSVFARGARGGTGRNASLMSMLQPFNRLLVSWSAGAEAGTLSAAEFAGTYAVLPADRVVSGCYLNELLLTLLTRHDPHADVFELYSRSIDLLKTQPDPLPVLRLFEKRLLEALGYGLALTHDAATGLSIDPDRAYHYRLEQGAVMTHGIAEGALVFQGASLLALAREQLHDVAELQDARRLLRAALDRLLEGRELKSRQVMMALRKKSDA